MEYERRRVGELDCIVARVEGAAPQRLAVLCHGFGAPGTDLVDLGEALVASEPNLADTVFVFPAALIELEMGFDARAWWPINFAALEEMTRKNQFGDLEDSVPPGIETQRGHIERVITELSGAFSIGTHEVFVGGFSQGAMLATDVFLNHAEPLGGLIIWSGTLINRQNWRERMKLRSGLRVVQSHGRLDPILPFQGAIHLRDLFVEHAHQVDFHPFQGYHSIPQSAVSAAARFIAASRGENC